MGVVIGSKRTLTVVLVASRALGGAAGVVADARQKALERREAGAAADEQQREAAASREAEIASAFNLGVLLKRRGDLEGAGGGNI